MTDIYESIEARARRAEELGLIPASRPGSHTLTGDEVAYVSGLLIPDAQYRAGEVVHWVPGDYIPPQWDVPETTECIGETPDGQMGE